MTETYKRQCVDQIRQNLLCELDTTILPFGWVLDLQQVRQLGPFTRLVQEAGG